MSEEHEAGDGPFSPLANLIEPVKRGQPNPALAGGGVQGPSPGDREGFAFRPLLVGWGLVFELLPTLNAPAPVTCKTRGLEWAWNFKSVCIFNAQIQSPGE